VRLSLGWEEFALHGSHRGGNPDGWGVAYFAHGHRHTIPGEAISSDPGLYVLERNSVDGNGFDASCIGVACDGGKGLRAVVATTPLDDQPWTPLGEGEIACFEQGRRIR